MFDANQNNNYGGYVYQPQMNPQAMTKQASSLTQDEYNRLAKQDNAFSLALTETDRLRGICNHRTLDGTKDTLTQKPDGTIRCELCGYEFNPIDQATSPEDIKEAVSLVVDILQTIKLMYIDMPINSQREYFQIIPLIEKIPDLFGLAVKDFGKHENYTAWGYRNQNMGTMNLFNMLNNAFNSGQFAQQPQYGFQQPNYGPAQSYANQPNPAAQGYPVGAMPPTNGFGFNGGAVPPMGGYPQQPMRYQPQTGGFQYNPNMPQPQQPVPTVQQPYTPVQNPAPTGNAPAETQSTTDGQTVQTQATFKS